jgi:putative cardiolipin synthase
VYLLERGTDALVARLVLAAAAERSLDMQYYIWQDDTTGRTLLESVLRAADRGVRVRLLIDDLGTAAEDGALPAIDGHPNVEVRLFNPVANRSARLLGVLSDPWRVNRRMHNKSFAADNQVAFVGGRNVGDEYFEARPDLDFGDLDALVIGPAVSDISAGFDAYRDGREARYSTDPETSAWQRFTVWFYSLLPIEPLL